MKAVTPAFLGLDGLECLYWDLDHLDAAQPPATQQDGLKEDLAQFRLSASRLLDIGWYSSDGEGRLIAMLIEGQEWDRPLFKRSARSWLELREALASALAYGK